MAKSKVVDPTAPPSMIKDVLAKRNEHRLVIIAAGVALFAFISLIPGMAAAVSIVALVGDPNDLVEGAESALEAAPEETAGFLVAQLENIVGNSGAAGVAAIVGILLATFSASAAMGHLMEGLNVIYGRTESRNFVVKKITAILLMLGALITMAILMFGIAAVPPLVAGFIDSSVVGILVNIGRFPVIAVVMAIALGVLYRFGPAPDNSRFNELLPGGKQPLITRGGAIGTVLVIGFSAVLGIAGQFLSLAGAAYGTLATIIVVLKWLHLLAQGLLLGAEVDAHTQRQRVWNSRINAGLPAIRPEEAIAAAA